jgi:DNA polymerase-3 subunit epsilon
MLKRIEVPFPEWTDEVMSTDNYVFLDYESTGLGPKAQGIECAIVRASDESVIYNSFLKPSCLIEEGAMSIHHITESMVVNAPSFRKEWPKMEEAIGGRRVITWNAKFDKRIKEQTANAHGVTLSEITWYCAMLEYTRWGNFQTWVKLVDACRHQGLDFSQNHRALGDVMAMLEVFKTVAIKYTTAKIMRGLRT